MILPPPVVLFMSVIGPVLKISPLSVTVEPPSLVTLPPVVAVLLVIEVAAVVVTVGALKTAIVLVPCAATDPQVVGVPAKFTFDGDIAPAVIECPDVAPDGISAVTQK